MVDILVKLSLSVEGTDDYEEAAGAAKAAVVEAFDDYIDLRNSALRVSLLDIDLE